MIEKRKKSETRIQQEIMVFHWNSIPEERGLLFHVNNAPVNKIDGNRLKSIGMVKGVSDLVYLRPRGKTMLLEVKTEEGKQSDSQKKWGARVTEAGYEYHIVRSLEEAKKVCGW